MSRPERIGRLDVSRLRTRSEPVVIERVLDEPLVVLGSSQPDELIARDATIDVVRRRGGGGAVFVDPKQTIWIDLWLPAASSLVRDVRGLLIGVGEHLRSVLASRGVDGLRIVEPTGQVAQSVACFAALGFGELVDSTGRKLLGLTAWRSRDGALVQSAVYRARDHRLPEILSLDDTERTALGRVLDDEVTDLRSLAPPLGDDPLAGHLIAADLAALLGAELERRGPEREKAVN